MINRDITETAFSTGLRANELRCLTIAHLDMERSGLHLDVDWTKNRKSGFQPLPRVLAERLHAFAQRGEAKSLYEWHRRKDSIFSPPKAPLLYVTFHPAPHP